MITNDELEKMLNENPPSKVVSINIKRPSEDTEAVIDIIARYRQVLLRENKLYLAANYLGISRRELNVLANAIQDPQAIERQIENNKEEIHLRKQSIKFLNKYKDF